LIHKKPSGVPRPDLDSLPLMNADGKMKVEEDQSFFAKYWMYIVPIGLVVVTQGGVFESLIWLGLFAEEEPAEGGQAPAARQ
jgi:hypothetical protein